MEKRSRATPWSEVSVSTAPSVVGIPSAGGMVIGGEKPGPLSGGVATLDSAYDEGEEKLSPLGVGTSLGPIGPPSRYNIVLTELGLHELFMSFLFSVVNLLTTC